MYSMAYTTTGTVNSFIPNITKGTITSDYPNTTTEYDYKNVTDLESYVKLPYVIKKKLLATVGTWNGFVFTPESIRNSYENTDWEDKTNRSLFADHEDLKSKEWIGEVTNIVYEDDSIYGDLIIVDKAAAIKLAYGAKFGISPSIDGDVDGNVMREFIYKNFSVVINPAIKPAYINFSVDTELEEKNKKPYGDVKYADPGYQEDKTKRYPIDSEEHVRAAWSYINMPKNQKPYTKEQLENIKNRIKEAAKKYDINISEEKMSEEQIKKNKTEDSDSSKPKDNEKMQEENKEKQPEENKKTDMAEEKQPKPDGTGPHGKGMGPGEGKADGTGLKKPEDNKENLSENTNNFAEDVKAMFKSISESLAELNKNLASNKKEVKCEENKDDESKKQPEADKKEEKEDGAKMSKEFSEDQSNEKDDKQQDNTPVEKDEKDKKIEELSQKIVKLEEKLKVPDKKVRKAEYSNRQNNINSVEEQFEKHLDELRRV